MSYVLIVGASSDIARSIGRKYAENGFDLYLAARDVSTIEPLAHDIQIRTGQIVQCLELDIRDYQSHGSFYDALSEKPLGIITAVGYLGEQRQAEVDFEESLKIIDTNFTGIVSFLNIIANDFEKRGSGFVVGISSVAGERGRKSIYIYGAAKAAFSTYLSGLRHRLHGSNVQVLTVKPGFVRTKMTKGLQLPDKLTSTPEKVAGDIFAAQQKGKTNIFTMWIWRWIMLLIRNIPERLFKKMNF